MKKLIIRGGIFFALLAVLLYRISIPFRIEEYRIAETYDALYTTEPNKADVVFVGGSNAYSYWQSPRAWQDYGISVINMGTPSLQTSAMKFVIKEARKTQPDALYVITANSFKWFLSDQRIHFATNYMAFSKNKIDAINYMSDVAGFGLNRVKFFFPVMQFHAKWSTLPSKAYEPHFEKVKAGASYFSFLYGNTDVTPNYNATDEHPPLDPDFEACLNDLFDYIEENNIRVLFVRLPQAMGHVNNFARLNSVCDMIQERNFDFLDLHDKAELLDIDYTKDFYNLLHANIHGAVKFTDYLSNYLVQNYGFTDKRGMEGYEDWDQAGVRYDDYLKTAVFDFEFDHAPMNEIPYPLLDVEQAEDRSIDISWEPVEGADSLIVYRRRRIPDYVENPLFLDDLSEFHWVRVDELPGDATHFVDTTELNKNTTYFYRIVPTKTENGVTSYSRTVGTGAEIKTRR